MEMLHRFHHEDAPPGGIDADMGEAVEAFTLTPERVADDGDAVHFEGRHVAHRRLTLLASAEAHISVALQADHLGAEIEWRTRGGAELAAEPELEAGAFAHLEA